jgi:hypothetical protein
VVIVGQSRVETAGAEAVEPAEPAEVGPGRTAAAAAAEEEEGVLSRSCGALQRSCKICVAICSPRRYGLSSYGGLVVAQP